LKEGNLAGHSIFPLGEITWAGSILLRTLALHSSQCEPLSRLAETISLGFNTKYLQFWSQKYEKHLRVAGCIYCYCPFCLVFKKNRRRSPQKMLHHTIIFSEFKCFWLISRGFSVAKFWELALPQRWKFALSVVRTWLTSSLSRAFNRASQTIFRITLSWSFIAWDMTNL
jgi:hypothetical protein